ncbi:MAG TPA: FtsX-like permease family protein, partial [Rhodothermales bacterium]|nr:FtsX-like permease family protein [Rhodothermales bacterium]
FILLIACINFMNLATARSAQRAREVGVRKVVGAQRTQLIRQFLMESILLSLLSLVLAIGLAALALPVFNHIAGTTLRFIDFIDLSVILTLSGIVLFVGVLAGSYPAFYLSAFRPAMVLKNTTGRSGSTTVWLRKGLVVFQFVISCVLIVGTTIIYRQLDFLQNTRLGFDEEHVVVVELPNQNNEGTRNYEALKERWLRNTNVLAVTATSGIPPNTEGLYDFPVVLREGRVDSLRMATLTIDSDFAEAFNVEIVAGRDLSTERGVDATEGFLLNERAVQRLGLTNPMNQEITLYNYTNGATPVTGRVVGVVKDFHYRSMRHQIEPILFYTLPADVRVTYYSYLSVRINPNQLQETLAFLEREWQAFQPDRPFSFSFLDEQFDAVYRAEQRLGTLVGYFALLTIFVACLGLFGLASFMAEQRTKEIGVRKVLGASVSQIVVLLSRDFLVLVGIAFVVAAPLAYVAMHRWLDGFAYRVDISAGVFLLTGLTALGIALLTVSYQSVKAALTNPVHALRHD